MSLDRSQSAKMLQVLLWYDKPEVVLLETGIAEFVLAVRSASLESGPRSYVGGSMTKRRLRDYFDGKCDLRFAIAHANMRKFWKFNLVEDQTSVVLNHIKRSDPELLQSLPESGLFSRDHTTIEMFQNYVPDSVEQFDIDGSWDLGEFSQFYGQVEDIYYIVSDIERFDDPSTPSDEEVIITNAFDRPWDGGGSYVAFYKNVANDNDYHAPLRVSGIKYNSPGYVEIHANKEPFETLMTILSHFSSEEPQARKAYNKMNSFMSANKLKRRITRSFVSESVRGSLDRYARDLEAHLPGVTFDALVAMTRGDSIIAAKVLLSVFRRVERLHRFFDEGRVAHSQIELQT